MLALFGFLLSIIYSGIDRKLGAHMQNRIGPPILQPLYDLLKLIQKEDIHPEGISFFYALFPPLTLASAILLLLLLPLPTQLFSFTYDSLLLIYLLAMSSAFLILSGFSSNSTFASHGSWRHMLQLIGSELPFLIAFATLILATNSYSLSTSILASGSFSLSKISAAAPHFYPFAFLAFLLASQAKLSRPPFHIPDAETEIVAGITTDYSGKKLALLEYSHMLELFVLISLAVLLFIGYSTPLSFLLHSLIILFLLTALRFIIARFRIDQSIQFLWLALAPVALIDLVRVMLL